MLNMSFSARTFFVEEDKQQNLLTRVLGVDVWALAWEEGEGGGREVSSSPGYPGLRWSPGRSPRGYRNSGEAGACQLCQIHLVCVLGVMHSKKSDEGLGQSGRKGCSTLSFLSALSK